MKVKGKADRMAADVGRDGHAGMIVNSETEGDSAPPCLSASRFQVVTCWHTKRGDSCELHSAWDKRSCARLEAVDLRQHWSMQGGRPGTFTVEVRDMLAQPGEEDAWKVEYDDDREGWCLEPVHVKEAT